MSVEPSDLVATLALERLGADAEGRIDVLRFEELAPAFRRRVRVEGQRLDEP